MSDMGHLRKGGWNNPVGASLLAMDVNDDACFLIERVVFKSIASRLAPTGFYRGETQFK
jgi:hypothetical protein